MYKVFRFNELETRYNNKGITIKYMIAIIILLIRPSTLVNLVYFNLAYGHNVYGITSNNKLDFFLKKFELSRIKP